MRAWVGIAVLLSALAGCGSSHRVVPTTTPTPQSKHSHPRKPQRPRVVFPHNRPVPILEYHVVGAVPAGAPFPELYVARAAFAAQLRWLHAHGYQAVSLARVYDYWRHGYALPPRPVVLSFDDGYRGDFTNVRPLLLRYHWPAVLNLAVRNLLDRKLTAPQVRALARDGWEIDAHTINHLDLTTLSSADLRREVAGSRTYIRRRFGVPVDFFCYPAGRYDAAVLRAARAAGFLGATTENEGAASPRDGYLTLDRIRVNGSDGLSTFAANVGSR